MSSPLLIMPPDNAKRAVVGLHGLGSNAADISSIIGLFDVDFVRTTVFWFPNAPSIPVYVNNNISMPAWYDIKSWNLESYFDKVGCINSVSNLLDKIEAIDQIKSVPYRYSLGFSQGGLLAFVLALKYPDMFSAGIGLSTYFLLSELKCIINGRDQKLFWGHGMLDPVIPLVFAQKLLKEMNMYGLDIKFNEYVHEHTISADEIADVERFILNNEKYN